MFEQVKKGIRLSFVLRTASRVRNGCAEQFANSPPSTCFARPQLMNRARQNNRGITTADRITRKERIYEKQIQFKDSRRQDDSGALCLVVEFPRFRARYCEGGGGISKQLVWHWFWNRSSGATQQQCQSCGRYC